MDDNLLKKIARIMKKAKITANNQNSVYVIAMALKCSNLENLIMEHLEDLSKEAITTLLIERKGTIIDES